MRYSAAGTWDERQVTGEKPLTRKERVKYMATTTGSPASNDVTFDRVIRESIERLAQPQLVTVFGRTLAAIDDEHLQQVVQQISDDDLSALLSVCMHEDISRQRTAEEGN